MVTPSLFQRLFELFTAIEASIAANLELPALSLLYVGMDIVAALDRPAAAPNSSGADFRSWVAKYMLPGSDLVPACTAEDLWAARCALLHTYGAESELSRKGKARQVFYTFGETVPAQLGLRRTPAGGVVVVHVGSLLAAFKQGVVRFVEDLDQDPVREALVASRARKVFSKIPAGQPATGKPS